jgi:hypothetical protein
VPTTRVFARFAPLLFAGACFPTFHTARIDPGFRIDAGFTALGDQRRNNERQRPDHIVYAAPAYGFGRRVEVGIPVGWYFEEGFGASGQTYEYDRQFVVWPYVKLALNEPTSRNHFALIGQSAFIGPANIGFRYGRDFGSWEPHVGASLIFSGGPAGDDPVVTRYQELHQNLAAASIGATWNGPGRPTIEVGVLRNRYDEGAVTGDFGQPTVPHTLYDYFISVRVGLMSSRSR